MMVILLLEIPIIIKNKDIKNILANDLNFRDQFCSLDKAAKNKVNVWKLFSLQVLNNDTLSSGNFIESHKTIDNIVHDYSSILKGKHFLT